MPLPLSDGVGLTRTPALNPDPLHTPGPNWACLTCSPPATTLPFISSCLAAFFAGGGLGSGFDSGAVLEI